MENKYIAWHNKEHIEAQNYSLSSKKKLLTFSE